MSSRTSKQKPTEVQKNAIEPEKEKGLGHLIDSEMINYSTQRIEQSASTSDLKSLGRPLDPSAEIQDVVSKIENRLQDSESQNALKQISKADVILETDSSQLARILQ